MEVQPHELTTDVTRALPAGRRGPRRVLAAIGDGAVGDAAVRIAHARAVETGARFAVCHVVADAPDDPADAAARIAVVQDHLLARVERVVGRADVEAFVLLGDPARQIRTCAETWEADLVVLGRPDHAAGVLARLFRPGVVDRMVRWAPCAVLVTRASPGTGRILVGTDFSDPSLPVLSAAAAEQARTRAVVHVVHCVSPVALYPIGDPGAAVPVVAAVDRAEIEEALRARIDAAIAAVGLVARAEVVVDAPGEGLVALARRHVADLVIVGTHGRTGLARIALGSVAQHVVAHAPCPVLVVRLADS